MSLTSVDQIKSHLQGIGEKVPTEHDSFLDFTVKAVSAEVEEFLRRKIVKATYTSELHTGHSDPVFYPNQWPIDSVASVKIDGTAITEDTDFTDGIASDKWIKYKTSAGVWVALWREEGWLSEPMRLEITYDAGYAATAIPDDLEMAVTRLCVEAYLHRGKQGISNESFAGLTLNFDRWPADVVMALRKHQRPQI